MPMNYAIMLPGRTKISLVGSRFTQAAESRYAPIVGEALGVADALDKARFFVLGCSDLIVAVDHKPLLKILGNRTLDDITNTRLINLKEKTFRYRFRMVHISGIHKKAADAISRHPTSDTNPEKLCLPDDIAHTQNIMAIQSMFLAGIRAHGTADWTTEISTYSLESLRSVTWDRARKATASDEDTHLLVSLIENGMPQFRHELPHALRAFHQFLEHIHTSDGVIIYKDRVVIPPSLQQYILSALHSASQGTTSMMARAETSVF